MCRLQFVVGLAVLYVFVGLTHSWDIAVTHGDVLEFYTKTIKTNTVRFNSHHVTSLAYDEIYNMLLYVDKQNNNDTICAHDISTKVNQCFTKRHGRNIHGLAFDPATEILFFTDTNERSINWIPLKSGFTINENLLIKMDQAIPTDIAVDICRGFIYWINTNLMTPTIERARFDGSQREVIIYSRTLSINTTYKLEPHSLTIDHQDQRIYWIEPKTRSYSMIYYADLNSKIKKFLARIIFNNEEFTNPSSNTLTVLKSNLYRASWCSKCDIQVSIINKISFSGETVIDLHTQNVTVGIVANSKIQEQIEDIHDCEALSISNLVRKSASEQFCVHGTKVMRQSRCKCIPGYIGERCDISVCENYCIHGTCSVNDEGLPQCRCNASYSGKRCEVDACLNYCFQGNCSFSDEGLPRCSCNVGYSEQRCEAAACQNYCLNNGVCSLNEEDEPFCECADSYDGSRCEAVQTVTFTFTNIPTSSTEDTQPTLVDVLSNVRKNATNIFVIVDKS